nr:venom serine carboxypeptidase-like [Dermacentor andersoni]XP_054925104.1 venom serine carboxypeptidase-like [Dermacentor andersoni]
MHGYGKALLCLACFGLHLIADTAANPSNETAPSEQRAADDVPLFLTQYIRNGSIDEAQRRSKVDLFESRVGAKAHSGYVTVNESTGSNLFFLYVKAANNRSGETPLVLWLEGGPGKSALFGQFLESGPLGIGPDGQLYRRRPTLQEEADVVYLDQPVGGGYSFARDRRGFARTLDDIADSIEEFLRQFLVLFPENRNRRFYAIGESYGARSALGIVNRLQVNRSLPLRVSGVILGVPFVAPLLDLIDSSDYLYSTGLIDGRGHRLFAERFQQIKLAAGFNRTIAAALLLKTVFNAKFDDEPTLYQQLTGYTDHGSVLRTRPAPERLKYPRLRHERRVQEGHSRRRRDAAGGSEAGLGLEPGAERLLHRHQRHVGQRPRLQQGASVHGADGHGLSGGEHRPLPAPAEVERSARARERAARDVVLVCRCAQARGIRDSRAELDLRAGLSRRPSRHL